MKLSRLLNSVLILVMAACQLAASVHAVEHLVVHPQGEQFTHGNSQQAHVHPHTDHHHFGAEGLNDHDHNHPHPPKVPDADHSLEPDCLLYHAHLNLCAIAASNPAHFLVPPHVTESLELALPSAPIERFTRRSIRGPPTLS